MPDSVTPCHSDSAPASDGDAAEAHRHQDMQAGLWIILVAGLLLFVGSLAFFLLFRRGFPEVIAQGSARLDRIWTALGLLAMALGSGTMTLGLMSARLRRMADFRWFLGLTLVCGVALLATKYLEGVTVLPGTSIRRVAFTPTPPNAAGAVGTMNTEEPGSPAAGRDLYMRSCMACHGPTGAGVPGLGKSLTESAFAAGLSDAELAEFLSEGRPADDPNNSTGILMPPRGGNPALTDADLMVITAYLRSLQAPGKGQVQARGAAVATPGRSRPAAVQLTAEDAALFWRLYLFLSGLLCFYLLAAMGLIGAALRRGHRAIADPASLLSCVFGGLYWHATTALAFLMYALLYLGQ